MTAYMPAVGHKFNEDGSVRQFAGSTVICFLKPESSAYRLAVWAQEQLNASAVGSKITLLPHSSLHMTIFGVLSEDKREPEYWPDQVALDAPLSETDAFVETAVASVPAPADFQMRYGRLIVEDGYIAIGLVPQVEAALRHYRDALANATGIHTPYHDTYEFHITLAYPIVRYTPAEAAQLAELAERLDTELAQQMGTFVTGAPTLTFYDDMFAFVPASERHTLASR